MTKLRARTKAGPGYADPDRVRQEAERRRGEEDRWAPATLLPPEAFSDAEATRRDFQRLCEPGAGTGRQAAAVHRRIMSSCAGWRRRPTAAEFYEAVRARRAGNRTEAAYARSDLCRHMPALPYGEVGTRTATCCRASRTSGGRCTATT